MDPGPDVDFLLTLSPIEQAAISIFCPSIQVFKLGMHSHGARGHCISYIQNVSELSTILPLKPENLPVLVIMPPRNQNQENRPITDKQFTVRRRLLIDALRWLKDNSPDYQNIQISENVLNDYIIDNDILQNPPTVYSDRDFTKNTNVQENPENAPNTSSSVDAPVGQHTMRRNIETVIGETTEEEIRSSPLQWPSRDKNLASEFDHGYWSKAFPVLFPRGLGDITKRNQHPYQVPLFNWLQFLLQSYRRFSRHHLFVFVAASQYRRHKAMTLSNVFAEKTVSDMTVAEIKTAVQNEDYQVLHKLYYFGHTLEGTPQFFKYKKDLALSLIRDVRIKTLDTEMFSTFLTVSAADLHWEDLHRLLDQDKNYISKIVIENDQEIPENEPQENYITKAENFHLRSEAIKNNQDIVAYHLYNRVQALSNNLLKVLGLKNTIRKFEAQGRGTMHAHMLLHLEKSISIPVLENAKKAGHPNEFNADQIIQDHNKIIRFATKFLGISAIHPNRNVTEWRPPYGTNFQEPSTNCLQTNFLNVEDIFVHYEMLINRVMIHTCKNTCKKANCDSCRFKFPFELHGYYFYQNEENGAILEARRMPNISPQGASIIDGTQVFLRNHPYIVTHIPEILIVWNANTETRPTNSYYQVLYYLLGYVMKPEKATKDYKEMMKLVVNETNDDSNPKKLFCRILNKTIGERDITKQECFHILHGLPLVEFTDKLLFITVNVLRNRRLNLEGRPNTKSGIDDHSDFYWQRETDENYLRLLNYYQQNHEHQDDLINPHEISLYQFSKHYTKTWRRHNIDKVPHFIPNFFRIPRKSSVERYMLFLRTRLLEHKPGTTHTDIFSKDLPSLEEEMKGFVESDLCPALVKEDFKESQKSGDSPDDDDADDEPELNPSIHNDGNPVFEEWSDFVHPQPPPEEVIDENNQGSDGNYEDFDNHEFGNYNWNEPCLDLHISDQELNSNLPNWLSHTKNSSNITYPVEDFNNANSLNEDQFRAFAIAAKHLQDIKNDYQTPQLLLNVHGSAGCGKTFWLLKLLSYSSHLFGQTIMKNCALAGTAAAQIHGQTIHSLFNIPVLNQLPRLQGKSLMELQKKFEDVKLIALDEKSMVGQHLFNKINKRLKQATGREDLPFGGITMIIMGDWNQLPPIGDSSLYDPHGKCIEGFRLYSQFKDTVIFKTIMRQQGPEQQEFKAELERLYKGTFTLDDWKKWATRDLEALPAEEKQNFLDNAIYACARKVDMVAHNKRKIQELNQPIALIKSESSPASARLPKADNQSGLPSNILLCKGAKVRLISNEWTEAGLTNGADGTVVAILYDSTSKPPSLPTAVLVSFPDYIGPSYLPDYPNCVPITPITRKWQEGTTICSRTMLPLILGYALSFHRLQGKTIPLEICNPGDKEFTPGLMFTGVSRVKRFSDLAFHPMPSFQRFNQIKYPKKTQN